MISANASHCAYCFDVITAEFDRRIQPQELPPTDANCPLFVTFNISRKKRWELRGCIGTFSPQPLLSGLKEYAITSAFRDRRFSPMTEDELPFLQCGVSLLTNFEPAQHVHDWEVGKHGITIKFSANGRNYNATYLPEIASEQGWDHRQAVTELIYKSGYRQPITQQLYDSIQVTRYQSSKFKLTHAEYKKMRK